MNLFKMFWCWMYGHTPFERMLTFGIFDDEHVITYCTCCGATLAYDNDFNGWVKW